MEMNSLLEKLNATQEGKGSVWAGVGNYFGGLLNPTNREQRRAI